MSRTSNILLRRALGVSPLLGGAACMALALAHVAQSPMRPRDAGAMAVSFALVVVGSRLKISASTRINSGATWSMQAAMQVVALLVLGPWMAIPATMLASFVVSVVARRPLRNSLDNAGTVAIALTASAAVLHLLGGTTGQVHLPQDYLPIIAAALVVGTVCELTFAVGELAEAADLRVGLRTELHGLRAYLPSAMLESLAGMSIGIMWLIEPWATFVLAPLGYSLFLAMRRGVRVQQVTEAALESFANIVDERDRYTFEHSTRVCDLSMKIGERMGLSDPELEALYWTSRLHDLGKVAVDNSILNKPGKLTDEEFEVMKSHPVVSARILSSFSFGTKDTEVVLCHHERFDGRGYLRRTNDNVPLEAYIIAVADTFDAMTSDRPYRKGLSAQVALQEIERNIGSQFHPDCARAFLEVMSYQPEVVAPDIDRADELGSAGTTPEVLDGMPSHAEPDIVIGDDVREMPEAA